MNLGEQKNITVEETGSNFNDVSESTDQFDQNVKTVVDTSEEASDSMSMPDEVCLDKEYEKAMVIIDAKSICIVVLYPLK